MEKRHFSLFSRSKRAQAAMEFLMTYGWALLVVLIVIAALAFFGLLNPNRFLPDKVEMGSGFVAQSVVVGTNGIQMIVYNGMGRAITGVLIAVPGCDNYLEGGSFSSGSSISEPQSISEGGTEEFLIICTGLIEKTKFKSDLLVTYNTKTLSETISHFNAGSINSEVEGTVIDLGILGNIIFNFATGANGFTTNGFPPFYVSPCSDCGACTDDGSNAIWADQCGKPAWDDFLISPALDLSGMSNPVLSMDIYKDDEQQWQGAPFDKAIIVISLDGGVTWDSTLQVLAESYPQWETLTYDLSAYAGQVVNVGMVWPTLDSCCGFESIGMKNFQVTDDGPPACDCSDPNNGGCCPYVQGPECTVTGCEVIAGKLGTPLSSDISSMCQFGDGWSGITEFCYSGGMWDANYNDWMTGNSWACYSCNNDYSYCSSVSDNYGSYSNTACTFGASPPCTVPGCEGYATSPHFGLELSSSDSFMCDYYFTDGWMYDIDEYCYNNGMWNLYNNDPMMGNYWYCNDCDVSYSSCGSYYDSSSGLSGSGACPFI